jgi:hypothetical protein
VFLPRDARYNVKNSQPYRNMRAHLSRLNNVPAAGIIHSAELGFDRRTERFPGNVLSLLYERGSDYGSSIGMPLAWFVAFLLISTAFLGISDSVVVTRHHDDMVGTWQEVLFSQDWIGRIARAAMYSVQSVFNPLGVFGSRNLLAASTGVTALIAGLLCLGATLALALFVLALRRHFRLN